MAEKFDVSIIDKWVKFWNTFDLTQTESLFLTNNRVSYFSSEFENLIKGYDNIVKHHIRFGFVEGGKKVGSKLWLEDINVEDFGDSSIVCALWYFRRSKGEKPQKGPITFVFLRTVDGWKIAHANFGNYK